MLSVKTAARNAGRALVSLIFPPRCVICDRVLDGIDCRICRKCLSALPWAGDKACVDARKLQIEFAARAIAPTYYEGGVREAILRYKFNGLRAYAPVLARLIAQEVGVAVGFGEILPPEVVTFVPISKKRRRKRGYDQAELLARAVARALGLPLVKTLEKTVDTPAQSTLDEKTRKANIVGAYRVRPEAAGEIAERHVLLIDDVLTTGATLSEAAKTVAYLLPGSIVCAAIAQTRPKTQKNS